MACELAGVENIPAIVRNVDRDTAIIMMVDSNLQREYISPMEKARAYKMKNDAMKRQGERSDLTCYQVGNKLEKNKKTTQKIAEDAGESQTQVHRFIRLNELTPDFQKMVDEGKIGLTTDFKVTYKDVTEWGWRIYTNNNSEDELFIENGMEDGDVYEVFNASLKEGKTKPKPRFTEDTLLSAMEHASAAEMPEDAEWKGLGTPATRAGIIEKLIATGFIERKKEKKSVSLVPSNTDKSLITVIPEHIQSPLLTAEWEHEGNILLHRASKKAFNELGIKKLPKVKDLNIEYAELMKKKKQAFSEYYALKDKHREMLIHKSNIDSILGVNPRNQQKTNIKKVSKETEKN